MSGQIQRTDFGSPLACFDNDSITVDRADRLLLMALPYTLFRT